jgi:hypothetical protein
MKYRYKDTDIIVESGKELDSALFCQYSEAKEEKKTVKKTTTKKTAAVRKG